MPAIIGLNEKGNEKLPVFNIYTGELYSVASARLLVTELSVKISEIAFWTETNFPVFNEYGEFTGAQLGSTFIEVQHDSVRNW